MARAEGIYVGWSMWQREDGRRLNVQVIGLDQDSVGGPWAMREGEVDDVHIPDSVIVDELFLDELGVRRIGDEFELRNHKKATVRGICREVRTFTASPFVFTSMRTAPNYDASYHPDQITYVLVKCQGGTEPERVAQAIRAEVPAVEVLTSRAFMTRSVLFWLVGTGMGLIVGLTAVLGIVVSMFVTSQTLFNITQDHLAHYATLLAVGFSRRQILACVLIQGLALTGIGDVLGGLAYLELSRLSAGTPAPLELTPIVFAGLVATSALGSLLGSILSVCAILNIDPVVVFRG